MYYLRLEPYERTIPGYTKLTGDTVPPRKYMTEDRAVYKHDRFSRFYVGSFNGIDGRYQGMKLYTCKTIKRILQLREDTFNHCGERFDVYDENGKVDLKEGEA